MHCGYIVQVNKLRPHGNADRLQIADFFGNETCVSLDVAVGDIGIYFPTDLQLSTAFCEANNLVRKRDENGKEIGGFLDPVKRNVKTIRLRGEPSDGIYLPISALEFTGVDLNTLEVGATVDTVNGVEICRKYIPRSKGSGRTAPQGNKVRKKKVPVAPLFTEHADTEQLAYNLHAFKPGDLIEITLKMHGTSGRTGYLPVLKGYNVNNKFFKGFVTKNWNNPNLGKVAQKCLEIVMRDATPIYEWGYISGTRRVVLDSFDGGFYGNNSFREKHSKSFEGKLHKGETVYYEIVGFTDTGAPIMGDADNKKLNDKEFIKQYGDTTRFSYGCVPLVDETPADCVNENGELVLAESKPQSDIYVYRMTMTNEDGVMVEYSPDFMRYRCEQMGVKTVPVFTKMILADLNDDNWDYGEAVKSIAEKYYDGPDPIGKTHIREGVVVRVVNRPKFCAYKHKNFNFKVLEGIIKENAVAPDMEEAQEVNEE
jgi:hypothetical protein